MMMIEVVFDHTLERLLEEIKINKHPGTGTNCTKFITLTDYTTLPIVAV